MNFKQLQENVKTYIKQNLPSALADMDLDDFDDYIDDFIDLDKYAKKKQLFFDFVYHNFDNLSNESESDDMELKIVMTFRGAKHDEIRDNMLNYATAFYHMFSDSGCSLGGAVDNGIIQTVNFYPYAEGNPDIKVAELVLHLYVETD